MSSDIYAKPDLSSKVRYNRKEQGDGAEWEEREVDIYENAERIREDHTDCQSLHGGPSTLKHPPVQQRPFRAALLGLGVVSLLMVAGIITLSICYISVRSRIQTEVRKLQEEIAVNYSQLQSSYKTLRKNHSHLQDEVKKMEEKIEGKWCPGGWRRFRCSCYFKSIEKKTWDQSRRECQNRGAELVIINSKEEQEFVTELNENGESWIGLRRKWNNQGYTREWEWVDGSPLTPTFWATEELKDPKYWYYAACCDPQGKWTGSVNYNNGYIYKNWICEK
ncbi:CD209 antigen-like protein C [Trachinotus anak]|uniref:CD209 antigen-like protein C n=1 Tax=Trachinotus anak TaxID=443729 RepID=UPI0039F1980F